MSAPGPGPLVEQVFSGALSLMGILIAVVGILVAEYDKAASISWLAPKYRLLTGGAASCVVLAAISAFLALLALWGRRVPPILVLLPLALLIGLVTVGIPFMVAVVIF